MKRNEKQDWARLIFTKENVTQKEVARRVGVTEKTLGAWVKAGSWDTLRQSILVTKEEQLRRIYMQIQELNTFILSLPEGSRFANSKQADALNKLTTAARKLETEASIADIIEVQKRFITWIRTFNFEKAKEISALADAFIKDQLK